MADIGLGKTKTQDGKKIVSLVTFFPGHEYGYKSKEDYSKNGYVFLSGKESQPLSSEVPLVESRMFNDLFRKSDYATISCGEQSSVNYPCILNEASFDLNRWQKMAGVLKG